MYFISTLRAVGITASTPKTAIEQALLIDSAKAIEIALTVSLVGIHKWMSLNSIDSHTKIATIRAISNDPLFRRASMRLNQLQHEGA